MKRIMKRFILVIFALSVIISMSAPSAYALASEYQGSPRRVAATPLSYSDSFDTLFDASSYEYNHALARQAFNMSLNAFIYGTTARCDGEEYDADNVVPDSTGIAASRYSRISSEYSSLGFDEAYYYNYGVTLNDTSDKVAFSVALKHLSSGDTLISVIIRGLGYCAEWKSNFNIGASGRYHEGFYTAAEAVMEKVTENPDFDTPSGNIKFLVSGISRGAAVANIVGAMLDSEAALSERFDPSDVYTYTFACPPTVTDAMSPDDELYSNIHNIINPRDPVPHIIPSGWGFSRYGADRYFALEDVEGWTSDSAAASIAAINEYVTTEITSASDAVDIADSVGEIFELLNTVERTQSGTVEYISYERFSEILRERYGEKYDKAYERAEEDHALIESYGVLSDISSLTGFDSDGIMTALTILRLHGVSVVALRSLLMPIVSSIDVSSIMNGHYTEVYSAYMSRDADECFDRGDGYEIVRLSVLGDADITVIVGDETVSQISDGETVRSDVPTWSRAGITNIYLPSSDGTQYSVSITSESGKTLAYTVSEISYSLTTQNRAIYTGLSLGEGECASLSFSSASEFSDSKYNATVISDGDIRVYSASAVTDKSADTLTLELISDGEGETSGGGRYEIGDFVTVSARAMSGSRFIGWYLGESCISDDKVYTFCITESSSISARFERNERVSAPLEDDADTEERSGAPVALIISISVVTAILITVAVILAVKYKNKKQPSES